MELCKLFKNVFLRIILRNLRKRLHIFLLILSCMGIFLLYDHVTRPAIISFEALDPKVTSFPLLVNALQNQLCVHPSLDPNHPSVAKFFHPVPKLKCETAPDWVSVRNGSIIFLQEAETRHGHFSCRVVPILRGNSDSSIKYGKERIINGTFKAPSDFFKMSCKSNSDGKKYMNVHSTVAFNNNIFQRIQNYSSLTKNKLSVLMFGFDSVSRNTWQRMLPSSLAYLKNYLRGVVLEGYNIVGDGTPQALLPILTGKTEEELPEARRSFKGATFVDGHPWIWKNFSRNGYVTQWGEDMAYIGTFNMRMTGFKDQPVDHYMRPFYTVSEKLHKFFKPFCLGSKPRHRIMFNYLRDFVEMYREFPKFSFLFHSEYSHGDSNNLAWADNDLLSLLKYLNDKGHLNSTVLVIMSDHGPRFHEIRQTLQGKYEERMPFFSFRFPEWFPKIYPNEYKNLLINSKRLVTPFDIHATFEHILRLSNPINNFRIANESRSMSILNEIPRNRSCYDAGIAPHWCACLPWKSNNVNNLVVENAVRKIVSFINSLTKIVREYCSSLSVSKVIRAMTFIPQSNILQFVGSSDKDGRFAKFNTSLHMSFEMLQITFQTNPGNALFEATVVHDKVSDTFLVNEKEISRTNSYGSSANCIANIMPNLRQYCFCF